MPEIKKYLNRDGLDEYNSLLPHSSAEMQTYVNDWLDEHPEATTTVQDGAITEPKLADKSVSLRTLADDTVHMLKGAILTGNLSGEVLTADDAYAAPPMALTVEGKSTQASYTGKNLFDNTNTPLGYYDASNGVFVSNNNYRWWSVPVTEGDVIRYANCADCILTYYLDGSFVGHGSQAAQGSYTVPAGVDGVRGYCAAIAWNTGIVTLNNANLTYEPYTGGKPSPSPDYPQEIVSVENPVLTFAGKNLLKITGTSGSHGSITYTVNADGTITASGTQPGTGYNFDIGTVEVKAGLTYHLSGCPTGGSTSTYRMYPANKPASWYDTGNGATFTPTADETLTIRIVIGGGATYSGLTFKPQLELGSTATEYEPYVGTTVQLPVTLRSLPDGTKDTMALSYLRPSTREGWAWYSRELVQTVGEFLATSPNGWVKSSAASNGYYKMVSQITDGRGKSGVGNGIMSPWFKAANSRSEYLQTVNSCWVDSSVNFNIDPATFSGTASEFGAWVAEHNIEFYMPLANPITTTLDSIELPVLPAPDVIVWADPSTGLQMEYVRNANIVIQNIEQAIADQ